MAGSATWIALLRGVNVGGQNKLPMADLRSLLIDLGCEDVRTYVQSGNAVFTHPITDKADLGGSIRAAIEKKFSFSPGVMMLGDEVLLAAIASNPFKAGESDPKTLHLFFLDTQSDDQAMGRLQALSTPTESIHLDKDVLYLHAPDGIGKSKLVKGAEKALGVAATARNWRTVTALAEMVDAPN